MSAKTVRGELVEPPNSSSCPAFSSALPASSLSFPTAHRASFPRRFVLISTRQNSNIIKELARVTRAGFTGRTAPLRGPLRDDASLAIRTCTTRGHLSCVHAICPLLTCAESSFVATQTKDGDMNVASIKVALIAATIVAIGALALFSIGGATAQQACIQPLSGNGTYNGTWDNTCLSENTPLGDYSFPTGTRYARFYTFTLSAPSTVTVELRFQRRHILVPDARHRQGRHGAALQ